MEPVHRRFGRRTKFWAGAVTAALALSVTAVGQASAADVNNAKNAGFEAGLSNWSCSANSGTERLLPGARRLGRPQGVTERAGQRPVFPDGEGEARLDVRAERRWVQGRVRVPGRDGHG